MGTPHRTLLLSMSMLIRLVPLFFFFFYRDGWVDEHGPLEQTMCICEGDGSSVGWKIMR